MNWQKLLKQRKRISFVFLLILFFAGCTDKTEKQEYIARVNNSYLTAEEYAALADSGSNTDMQKQEIINNWIKKELLYHEAVKKGINENDEYKRIVEKSRKELAGAILLNQISADQNVNFQPGEVENYYKINRGEFKLTSNSFLLNIVSFSDRSRAVEFRTKVISSGWKEAIAEFTGDSTLLSKRSEVLINEPDIYPIKVARVVKALNPPENSIVISDDAGYYTVVQVLNKFKKNTTPPFKFISEQVEERYLIVKTKQLIDNYIDELYSQGDVEINY
jgi:hypothetical protein